MFRRISNYILLFVFLSLLVTASQSESASLAPPTILPFTPTAALEISEVGSLSGNSYALAIEGNTAYVGNENQFRVVDISNPTAPTEIGALDLTYRINAIEISGTTAYVGSGEGDFASTVRNGEFHIIDISDPTSPTVLGSRAFPGENIRALGLDVGGTIAYVGGNRLHFVAINFPPIITIVGDHEFQIGLAQTSEIEVDGTIV